MKLIDNRETLKLELHFDRAEYDAMTDEQKKKIKSSYLWSKYGKCWVSRSKYPNHYMAERVAQELGAGKAEKTGERLTMAERVEVQADNAERRAERYEHRAENAEHRAESLQGDFNEYRKDIAWLTQPIIAGHAGSRAFANHRNRVMARYEKGMQEYKKSEYYQERAAIARETADNAKIKNAGYLERRIKECNASIKKLQSSIVSWEEALYKVRNGEAVSVGYPSRELTEDEAEERIEKLLDLYDFEEDKLNYYEDCLNEIGGIKYSRENIKPGYVVLIGRHPYKVNKANPQTVEVITDHNFVLKYGYGDICGIVSATEEKPKNETEPQPYQTGDILGLERPADGSIYRAFQVVNHTEKTIKLRPIRIEKDQPKRDAFTGEPITKKPTINKFSGQWAVYHNDWQLHLYNGEA